MERISSNMSINDTQYQINKRNQRLYELNNKISSQSRIHELRDDPLAAAHSTRYLSRIEHLNRYAKNAERIQSEHRVAEGYMNSANQVLHRIRELAVQGANDTFTREDKRAMGQEINQLLNELLEIANARHADGTAMFGGDRTDTTPFRVLRGTTPGMNGQVVTGVEYRGDIKPSVVEIGQNSFMEKNLAGNEVFWAEQQQVLSVIDAQNYTVVEDSSIEIDGEEIQLSAGDNIHSIIAKINDADVQVKASLDPVRNSLSLTSTTPHQIWLKDGEDGSVLQDLGIISETGRPPFNINRDADISGGSLFDMVIYLRDRLYEGDTIDIGGGALKGIDLAQDKLVSSISKIGSQDERLDFAMRRIDEELPKLQQQNSKEVGLDMAKAITDLKELQHAHQAALGTAGRIIQPTLLDFLR
ncbi:MAG TPA: flagellar hook-associated protein 3 [Sediminispirochaeta sp.]|nr:flagellar hook-associated protein 3 [Sediminispirochaeta sp.]